MLNNKYPNTALAKFLDEPGVGTESLVKFCRGTAVVFRTIMADHGQAEPEKSEEAAEEEEEKEQDGEEILDQAVHANVGKIGKDNQGKEKIIWHSAKCSILTKKGILFLKQINRLAPYNQRPTC